MKKLAITLFCCLMTCGVWAGNPHKRQCSSLDVTCHFRPMEQQVMPKTTYQYRMTGYVTNDSLEQLVFYYNSGDQLVATYDEVQDEYKLYDSSRYDTAGRLVGMDGYQWLQNRWQAVYRVVYTYNEAGLLSSRSNYNYMNNEWKLGGVYVYTYNAQGQITESQLTLQGSLYARETFEYSNGKLSNEVFYQLNDSNIMDFYYKAHHTYVDSRPSLVTDSAYSAGGWQYAGKAEYTYDANGNCTEFRRTDANGRITERSLYEYDSRLVANTLIPINPETVRPNIYTNQNLYTIEHWYTLDVDYVLQHACDYLYSYSGTAGICCNDARSSAIKLYPNPANRCLSVEGLKETALQLEIFDVTGSRMSSVNVMGGTVQIDVSSLPVGSYILRVTDAGHTRAVPFIIAR